MNILDSKEIELLSQIEEYEKSQNELRALLIESKTNMEPKDIVLYLINDKWLNSWKKYCALDNFDYQSIIKDKINWSNHRKKLNIDSMQISQSNHELIQFNNNSINSMNKSFKPDKYFHLVTRECYYKLISGKDNELYKLKFNFKCYHNKIMTKSDNKAILLFIHNQKFKSFVLILEQNKCDKDYKYIANSEIIQILESHGCFQIKEGDISINNNIKIHFMNKSFEKSKNNDFINLNIKKYFDKMVYFEKVFNSQFENKTNNFGTSSFYLIDKNWHENLKMKFSSQINHGNNINDLNEVENLDNIKIIKYLRSKKNYDIIIKYLSDYRLVSEDLWKKMKTIFQINQEIKLDFFFYGNLCVLKYNEKTFELFEISIIKDIPYFNYNLLFCYFDKNQNLNSNYFRDFLKKKEYHQYLDMINKNIISKDIIINTNKVGIVINTKLAEKLNDEFEIYEMNYNTLLKERKNNNNEIISNYEFGYNKKMSETLRLILENNNKNNIVNNLGYTQFVIKNSQNHSKNNLLHNNFDLNEGQKNILFNQVNSKSKSDNSNKNIKMNNFMNLNPNNQNNMNFPINNINHQNNLNFQINNMNNMKFHSQQNNNNMKNNNFNINKNQLNSQQNNMNMNKFMSQNNIIQNNQNNFISNNQNMIPNNMNKMNMNINNNFNMNMPMNMKMNMNNNFNMMSKNNKNMNMNKNLINNKNMNIFYRPVGLKNIGATCFMNATLQCLSHCDELTSYLLNSKNYNEYQNHYDIFPLTYAYANVLNSLFPPKDKYNKSFAPTYFKKVIGNLNELFKSFEANDSKDLLIYILERIHLELKIPNGNNNINNNIMNYNPNSKLHQLNLFLNQFNAENTSVVSKNFYGINESTVQCLNCGFCTFNFNIYNFIIFPLEEAKKFSKAQGQQLILNQRVKSFIELMNNVNKGKISLKNCFEYNQKVDCLVGENEIYCNNCHRSSKANIYPRLFSTPKILCIVLNRGRGNVYKIDVDFPEIFDMAPFVTFPNNYRYYELIGVITHLGESGASGHFIAICKSRVNRQWYFFNDDIALPCTFNDALNKGTPYILFYHAR